MIYLILVPILATALFVIFKIFYKKHVNQEAEELVGRVYAIWARLGPFNNGADSAKAMEYASAAVMKNFEESSPIDVKGHSISLIKLLPAGKRLGNSPYQEICLILTN
jgi:hypothetical protein